MNPLASHQSTPPSSSAATALRGASLAFQKKHPAPPLKRDNGALTAATSVGQYQHRQMTGDNNGEAEIAARAGRLRPNVTGGGRAAVDPKSPSFIAATLAVSRSASPSPKPLRRESAESVVDSGSIAPTGSLISMFELVRGGGDPVKTATVPEEALGAGKQPLPLMGLSQETVQASPSRVRQRLRAISPPPISKPTTQAVQASPPRMKQKSRPTSPPPVSRTATQAPSTMKQKTRSISPPLTNKPGTQEQLYPKLKQKPRPISPPPMHMTNKSVPQTPSPSPKQKRRPGSPPVQMTNKSAPQPPSPSRKQKQRPISPPLQMVNESTAQPSSPKSKQKPRPISPPSRIISMSTTQVLSPKPKRLSKPQVRPVTPPQIIMHAATPEFAAPPPAKRGAPTPPKPRGSAKPPALITAVSDHGPILKPEVSRPQVRRQQKPTPPPPRRSPSLGSVSSNDTFVSASSAPSPERASPPQLFRNRQPTLSLPPSPTKEITKRSLAKTTAVPLPPRPRRQRPTNSSTASLPLDSLTNAIMASSLASARLTPHNTGTSLAAPPLPKRQKSPRLMQTLRQPAKLSDEESPDRHKKGHLSKLHSGKHAHHEGSRRKWREEITPRERKRYEAVWASNRGVLLDYHQNQQTPQHHQHGGGEGGGRGGFYDEVVNVVVREIWKRSRLPADELTEVWDLVDRKGLGMLGRTEFVVGMWLIDQRLRGRKIPAKVSDSVWGSANGMKVMKPRIR